MFELKEIENPVEFGGDFQLFDHHGKLLDKVRVDREEVDGSFWLSISTFGEETSQLLNSLRLDDFENRIDNIRLLQIEKLESFDLSIGFFRGGYQSFEIKFFLDTDLFKWKQFYGFSSYKKLLRYLCEKEGKGSALSRIDNPISNFDWESSTSLEDENNEYQLNETIIISFITLDDGEQIGEREEIGNVIKKSRKRFIELHEKTIEFLTEENIENTLISYFAFPEQIKVPCEQYLLYFAQFLQDLGINANSNLKEEAGKVLFSVTPTDDFEALKTIRQALAVYLKLPESPIVYGESFAAMRLQQQVENLQHSQKMAVREIRSAERELRLSQTVIEHQDKIIVQKDTLIEQQNKVIEKIQSKSIMMDSLENKDELEEIYDGLKIGESEFLKKQLGIHLNPAKVIKTVVKNTFGKDEKKSVLGLDEES